VQKIKRWKPMSKRPIVRPKTLWEDDVLEDIKSINIRNWKKVAQNRDIWKKVVEQARTLYRLSRFIRRIWSIFLNSWFRASQFNVNKNPTRCNSMQIFIHCKVTLHVSGVRAPIIRSTKKCNRNLRYR